MHRNSRLLANCRQFCINRKVTSGLAVTRSEQLIAASRRSMSALEVVS